MRVWECGSMGYECVLVWCMNVWECGSMEYECMGVWKYGV